MTTVKLLTAEQFMAIDEDGRYELIDGEVAYLSPSKSWHATVSGRVTAALNRYADRVGRGESPVADGGFLVSRQPDSVLCPDASFVSAEKMALARDSKSNWYLFAPDIAVEVLSPSDSRRSLARKIALYLAAGTQQVWVVDTTRETLTVHAVGLVPRTLHSTDTLDGGAALPGSSLALAQLFR